MDIKETAVEEDAKEVWETPKLVSEAVEDVTQAGFAGVKIENMFYTDS